MVGLNRFAFDLSVRRPRPDLLLGGSPLRMFRVSAAGRRVLDDIGARRPLAAGHQQLTDRLLDAGAIHPLPARGASGLTAADVTVVVPAWNVATIAIAHAGPVVVVDDASAIPVVADRHHTIVRRATNGGPAAARNDGLTHVDTQLVAFVDTDVMLVEGWLDPLLDHFADDHVALVAPRVRTSGAGGMIARYEQWRGALDLGERGGRIESGTRISYVPAAAIVCRAAPVRDIGGFDETLRYGEDVDLVWRLRRAGHRCRYEPASAVEHAPRQSLGAFARQRFQYGTSAAPLAERHPSALAPVRVSRWNVLVVGLLLARRPLVAAGSAAAMVGIAARRQPALSLFAHARLGVVGHVGAARQLASATRREWWPVAVAVALVSRHGRRALAVSVAMAAADWWPSAPIDPVRGTALRLVDDAAYGLGVRLTSPPFSSMSRLFHRGMRITPRRR